MIDYGSEDDIAKLIAHKLGSYPDLTHNNIQGFVLRVLAMMAHRPADVHVMVKKVSDILAAQGKMNESILDELSIADIEDETIHSDKNEQSALELRSTMQKYQPINMARASKLVSRKYEGEKSLPDIHDTLMRFVKYLKLDGKFVNDSIEETPVDTHAMASSAVRSERDKNLQRQRRQAEEMNKEKKIHQVASRNIRGDSVTVAEASKHREIMDAHFKRAREMLYGFPTATKDESSTTTVMSSGPTCEMMEDEELESSNGADGQISQDGDTMTEEPASSATQYTLQSVLHIDGKTENVEVLYAYAPDNAESPVEILKIKQVSTNQEIAPDTLSAVDHYNLVSQCFHAYHDEPEAPMTEGDVHGAHNLSTIVSTPDEDEINVVVNYDMEEDDDGGYVVIRSIKRVDDQSDIMMQVDKLDLADVEEECYQDYMAWAQEENDQQQIDNHIWNKANESLDIEEDMRPPTGPISDERAARKVILRIMGLPNLTYARVELWVSKLLAEIGKTETDIENVARLAYNEMRKVGMAVRESADDGETIDEAMSVKTRNATLTLPIDDPDYETDDVDVTVSYNFDGGNGRGGNDPDGMSVEIFKVVRDDTQEDITTQITTEQLTMLMQGCADAGDFDDRDPDAMREGDDDQAYLDQRESDYAADAGPGLTKGTYMSWGKKFNTYVFDNDAAANNFMEENSGWGVIGVDADGKVHVAKMEDTGMEEGASNVGATRTMKDVDFKPYFSDPQAYDEFVATDGDTDPEVMVDLANDVLHNHGVPLEIVDIDFNDGTGEFEWKVRDRSVDESEGVIKVPRDEQRSLENEIEVGGIDGPKQQRAYIARMKALAGLK